MNWGNIGIALRSEACSEKEISIFLIVTVKETQRLNERNGDWQASICKKITTKAIAKRHTHTHRHSYGMSQMTEWNITPCDDFVVAAAAVAAILVCFADSMHCNK